MYLLISGKKQSLCKNIIVLVMIMNGTTMIRYTFFGGFSIDDINSTSRYEVEFLREYDRGWIRYVEEV
jgi:hypothetical protein